MVNENRGEGKTPEDYGPVHPRTYNKCPVCGCPARFTFEAMKEDFDIEKVKHYNPALATMTIAYQDRLHVVKLIAVVDSCVKCGAIYTLARDKKKEFPRSLPKNPRATG